ncbi:MAG: transglycosylase SLT domain-containing protein [Acetobacter aceti]|uniref:Lytic transglycosylase n=1 Tax=Acetobacter aceti TaxID=435 RepID=A0A1U9KHR1_ACEAC|nr:transglycosylase SLT domain-containing protein [Acetobacter aceti]AQS85287.1 lytic transglycosylase [Acetobacter aceti]
MRRFLFLAIGCVSGPVSGAWAESQLPAMSWAAHPPFAQRDANGQPFWSTAHSPSPFAASGDTASPSATAPAMTQPTAMAQMQSSGNIAPGDARLCTSAILMAERSTRIPDQFLVAMGRVESGRHVNGELVPWPWTVNAQGKGYVYDNKREAMEAVRAFQAQGIRSIDVGCMQVNLQQHADAFPSLEAAFDPSTNAMFAARFLTELFGRTGSWPRAAAAYHSFTPNIGSAYQWKVLESWAMPSSTMPSSTGVPHNTAQSTAMTPHHTSPLAPSTQPTTPYVTSRGAAATMASMGGGGGSAAAPAPSAAPSRGYAAPASRPAFFGGESGGRSLASYRANPVHMVRQAMILPPRF